MHDAAVHPVRAAEIARGVVEEVVDGLASVRLDCSDEIDDRRYQIMHGSDTGLTLSDGDAVVVWHSGRPDELGVVLGRVDRNSGPRQQPDELVIEAKQSLTLKVGDGSITIREDGRILIKGKDLVSHAKRTNRIRGGSVQIN
jgi:hypothetical protein